MNQLDGNTAALHAHEVQQDRAIRDQQDYRAEAYTAALDKITREEIWDAWWDDPVHALGPRHARYVAAVEANDHKAVGQLTCEAFEWIRHKLVTLDMIQDEAARLAADDRRTQ